MGTRESRIKPRTARGNEEAHNGRSDVRRLIVPLAAVFAAAVATAGDGTASTVVDLRTYEEDGSWSVVRAGAVEESAGAAMPAMAADQIAP